MNCASTSIDARCWKWQDLQEVAYFNAEFAWEDTWFHHLWVSVKNSDCRPFLLITDLSHNHPGVKCTHSSLKFLIVSKKVLRLFSLLIANAHVGKTKEKQRCCNFHYHLPFSNLTASLLLAELTRPTWGKKKVEENIHIMSLINSQHSGFCPFFLLQQQLDMFCLFI